VIRRVAVSSNRSTVPEVWRHYQAMHAAIARSADAARRSLTNGTAPDDLELLGKSTEEANSYFESLFDETDKQACLFLIAAAEAAIRVDFLIRVHERRKDHVSRAFRGICSSMGAHGSRMRIRLEDDILDTWAAEIPQTRTCIVAFKAALRYRNWLAHGRYWVPKLGQEYDPSGLVQIISEVLNRMGVKNN